MKDVFDETDYLDTDPFENVQEDLSGTRTDTDGSGGGKSHPNNTRALTMRKLFVSYGEVRHDQLHEMPEATRTARVTEELAALKKALDSAGLMVVCVSLMREMTEALADGLPGK